MLCNSNLALWLQGFLSWWIVLFLYQNSFSFLLSAGLRLHAPVTRSYQHLIVCNLWLLHFFTPFSDLFFLAPLDCMTSLEKSVFLTRVVNDVLLPTPWGHCIQVCKLWSDKAAWVKGGGGSLNSECTLLLSHFYIMEGPSFPFSLFFIHYSQIPILLSRLSSICFDAQIASDLASGNTFKGAPVYFWQSSTILVRAFPFLCTKIFLLCPSFTFSAPVLESVISPEILGSF